jgi:DNA-directed RNA polymerase sigma subunit (sigma70/sigma32)
MSIVANPFQALSKKELEEIIPYLLMRETMYEIVNLEASAVKRRREIRNRGAKVVKMRFGFPPYDEEMTLEECGREFGVSKERIRQIEAKMLRRIRHRSISRLLSPFYEEEGEFYGA